MHEKLSRRALLAGSLVAPVFAGKQARVGGVDDELRGLAAHAPLAMEFTGTTPEECRQWQARFSAKLQDMLGPFRPPSDWKTIVQETVELKDHRRESLILEADGERPLPVYLLTPKIAADEKHAGILALHGHGKWGNDPVVGIAKTHEAKAEIARVRYDYGLQLVRRGYVVAAPCFTPFGRRLGPRQAYRRDDPCAVTFVRMQALGKLLIAENLRDALWSFELLARRANVDPARLGCVGCSLGGRMTMLAAAIEPRIRVAVISGALNLIQERIEGHYGCGSQIIPGLLKFGDIPEIASLIAPRPCLWEVGNRDPLMVKDRLEPALERVRRAYRALSADDKLQVDYFDGAHRWNGVKAYPLLADCLGLH